MTFSIIEICSLFFVAINIFIVIILFFLWLNSFLIKKARIKAEREYYVNDCLLRVILSFCDYVKLKKEKKVCLTRVNDLLPQEVINQLKSKYRYNVLIDQLDNIVISGGDLDNE